MHLSWTIVSVGDAIVSSLLPGELQLLDLV